jgi:hypothetical protein
MSLLADIASLGEQWAGAGFPLILLILGRV